MFQAPQVPLSATRATIADGRRGLRQTIGIMRELVAHYRADPLIRNAATTAVFLTPAKDTLAEIAAIFRAVQSTVRYTRDVYQVETIQSPDKTLALRVGDCDDMATLLGALLESVGICSRFVLAGYLVPGQVEHVYVQAWADHVGWVSLDATEPHGAGWDPPDPVTVLYEVREPVAG